MRAPTSRPGKPTRSACCASRRTRPPARSANPSTRSPDSSSRRGNSYPAPAPSPTSPTARPGSATNTCSPPRPAHWARLFSTRRSSPRCAAKAGIPEADSRGALTAAPGAGHHRHQLLNAREPLSLADLRAMARAQASSSTRHYAAILQRTFSAAYKEKSGLLRAERAHQSKSSSTGTPSCPVPPRTASHGSTTTWARATAPTTSSPSARTGWPAPAVPYYLPKQSSAGQLLAVKDGIGKMLGQARPHRRRTRSTRRRPGLAIAALAERLASIPTPAGPTPRDLGTASTFIPLAALTGLRPATGDRHDG